jgi:hypothetical protein
MTVGHIFVIGAMKCGTTSLHYILQHHSEIAACTPKELEFFINNRSNEKYNAKFPIVNGITKYTLESSTAYTKHPIKLDCNDHSIPERLAKLRGSIKIIYVMRDPIDRINSHIGHNIRRKRVTKTSFDLSNPVAISSYATQLDFYRRYFSRDKFLLLSLDRMENFSRDTLSEIGVFLGLDTSYLKIGSPKNAASERVDYLNEAQKYLISNQLRDEMKRLINDYSFSDAEPWLRNLEGLIQN